MGLCIGAMVLSAGVFLVGVLAPQEGSALGSPRTVKAIGAGFFVAALAICLVI